MSMIVWILLGLALGLIARKIVSTTGEGTVVDILLGIVGAVVGGGRFKLFGGAGMTGFDIDRIYSAGAAVIGAIILLALYHAFFRRRNLRSQPSPAIWRDRSVERLQHHSGHGPRHFCHRECNNQRCPAEQAALGDPIWTRTVSSVPQRRWPATSNKRWARRSATRRRLRMARQRPPKERFRMPSVASKIQSGESPGEADAVRGQPPAGKSSRRN